MRKKGPLEKEELGFLNQLVGSLDQAKEKLKEAYRKQKPEQVKAIKEFILKIQTKIDEIL